MSMMMKSIVRTHGIASADDLILVGDKNTVEAFYKTVKHKLNVSFVSVEIVDNEYIISNHSRAGHMLK